MSMTQGQEYGYNVIMAGHNVYLTGDAGTGKSYLLIKVINELRSMGKNVMVTAATGLAALHIDGVTNHRAFGIPVGPVTYNKDNYDVEENIANTDVIIIDEISTCRVDSFDFIANKIFKANNIRKRYGKPCVQLVVCGDFFQLPPVITPKDKKVLDEFYGGDIGLGMAFTSLYWKFFEFKNIILTEVVRQDNYEFVSRLNKVRVGDKSTLEYIYKNSCKYKIPYAITLCGTNKEADEINEKELNCINSGERVYNAIVDGDVDDNDTTAERELRLRVGARVMILVNNSAQYVNGTLGTVYEMADDIITIKTDDNKLVGVSRYTWTIYNYTLDTEQVPAKLIKESVGTITQFPLRLAYAITIHKSQGQTYEYVNFNPYCWDCGQLYVALSRVTKLENLHINYELDMRYLVVSLNVIDFYNKTVKDANKYIDTTINVKEKKDNIFSNEENKLLDLLNNIGG